MEGKVRALLHSHVAGGQFDELVDAGHNLLGDEGILGVCSHDWDKFTPLIDSVGGRMLYDRVPVAEGRAYKAYQGDRDIGITLLRGQEIETREGEVVALGLPKNSIIFISIHGVIAYFSYLAN